MYHACPSFLLCQIGIKEFFRETDPDDGRRDNSSRGVMGTQLIDTQFGSYQAQQLEEVDELSVQLDVQ